MASYRSLIEEANKLNPDNSQAITMLMLELCNMDNTSLYLDYEKEVDKTIEEKFNQGVKRLIAGEPLQYILGYQWFYGYKLIVDPGCLIPRYETEELVANVLADIDYYFADYKSVTIADVGTGSGNIAIALKLEEPKLQMWATDISQQALDLAKRNSQLNKADITFLQGDMLQPLIDNNIRLDVLVSNPPYIPVHQQMQAAVVDNEPHVALFGGEDGLDFYRSEFENASKVIKEHSFLAFEIGYDEKDAISNLVKQYFPNDRFEILKDINGKDRMLFIYHNLEA